MKAKRYVIAHPVRRESQADGRIRFWGYIEEFGGRALRVITLQDGETVHNAFPDRDSATDSLYVEFQRRPSVERREIAGDVRLDLDEQGRPVGLDIDHASEFLHLDTLESEGLPLRPGAPARTRAVG